MPDSVTQWLRDQGLGEYAPDFTRQAIDPEALTELTDADLQTIGVNALGHRKRLLKAIATLRSPAAAASGSDRSHPTETHSAERRQLTVMFCDLVGSTSLTAAMDLEEVREVLTAYQGVSAEAIARFDGYIARYMGDGLLVYFGYPQAHEDDAERAVRAGLDVVRRVSALRPGSGVGLEVRIGIATGEVLAGDLIGEGASEERAVLGDTPNLAARLQALAEPGSVMIAASTRRLTGRLFDYGDGGRHALKGFRDPVQVWRVVGEARSESRFEATRNVEGTELVGRDAELLLLLERWERARAREGQVVLLSGEPGIGKSRLTHALRARIRCEPHALLQFQCSAHHLNSAYYPFIEHVQRQAGMTAQQETEEKLRRLQSWLWACNTMPEDAVPLMASLLSIPAPAQHGDLELSPQRRSERTREVLAERCVAPSRDTPVLMIVEDVHWADPTTLDVIGAIIDRAPERAMLLVVTHRPEFVPAWRGRGHLTAHSLGRLGKRQVAAIVAAMTRGHSLPAPLLEEIVNKTDGIPLFVEELTKAVLEAGAPATAGGRLPAPGPAPQLAIPSTLQDSLAARLDRLGAVKRVAQVAAAIGREFSYELLAALSDADDPPLRDALLQLEQAELIFRRGTPPGASYVFKHALVQDVAYGGLLRRRRESLHAKLAMILESRFPARAAQEPELLAHHYTCAGLTVEAITAWQRAAEHALARSAYRERLAHIDAALELLQGRADIARHRELELELQLARGGALMATHGYRAKETGEAFARARALAEDANAPRHSFAALRGLHGVHYARAELDTALEAAMACLALAQRDHDHQHLALAHRLVGQTHCMGGRLALAREHLELSVDLSARLGSDAVAALTGGGHHLMASAFLAQVLWLQGYPDQALAQSQDALGQAEQHFGAFAITTNLFFHCWIRGWRGEYAQLADNARRIRALATEHEISEWVAPGALLADWPRLVTCEAGEAAVLAKQNLPLVRALSGVMLPFKLGLLAEVLCAVDRVEARQVIEEALSITGLGERWSEAELLRIKATVLLGSDEKAAEECFRQALEVARAQGARSWELRAATGLAASLCAQNRREDARRALRPVYEWFGEGFETADLVRAKALLEPLE